MESELNIVYKHLLPFKDAIINTLNGINDKIVQAISKRRNTQMTDQLSQDYKISVLINQIVQNHIYILYSCKILEGIVNNTLVNINRSDQAKGVNISFNPNGPSFFQPPAPCQSIQQRNEDKKVDILNMACRKKTSPPPGSTPKIWEPKISDMPSCGNSAVQSLRRPHFDLRPVKGASVNIRKDIQVDNNKKCEPDTPSSCQVPTQQKNALSLKEPIKEETSVNTIKLSTEESNKPKISPQPKSIYKDQTLAEPKSDGRKTSPHSRPIHKLQNLKRLPSDFNPLRRPHYDWRQKVTEQLKNPKLKTTLTWTTTPIKSESPSRKHTEIKSKPKYEIADDDLSVGQKCIICHIVSPSEFYVRTNPTLFKRFEEGINDLLNKQYQYVGNNFKSKVEAREQLGDFCLGYLLAKRKWYRLEVLDWMKDDPDTILIQLVDYGEKFVCSFTNLKGMTDELYAQFPKMAIRCHLAGVYWPENEPWPVATEEFLRKVTKGRQFVTIFAHAERNSYAVDLWRAEDANTESLGELLIKNNYVFEEEVSPQDNYLDADLDSVDLEECNINEAVAGYDAKDEARICPFTNRPGGCFKGTTCRFEHGRLSKDGITTDKILTINRAQAKLNIPPVGEIIDLKVTGYINTCHFYAHILDGPERNEKLHRLMEFMNASHNAQTYKNFKLYPGIGELVLVKDNSQWYRGRCVGYSEIGSFEIFLVDFGYTTIKQLKDLREMKENLAYLPFQAVECILDNCQEKKDASNSLSKLYFYISLNMKTFRALVLETTDEFMSVQMQNSNSKDVGEILKKLGLGENRNEKF